MGIGFNIQLFHPTPSPMSPLLDNLLFFTKVLTALVVILNIALILCLRSHVSLVKKISVVANGVAEEFMRKKLLMGLVIGVMLINCAAVYGNHQMLKTVKDIASTTISIAPQTDPGILAMGQP